MFNLIEYSGSYSETSTRSWEHQRDEPNATLASSKSFKSKVKIPAKTTDYSRNSCKTIEMALINCEINLILSWSGKDVITNSTGKERFAIRM